MFCKWFFSLRSRGACVGCPLVCGSMPGAGWRLLPAPSLSFLIGHSRCSSRFLEGDCHLVSGALKRRFLLAQQSASRSLSHGNHSRAESPVGGFLSQGHGHSEIGGGTWKWAAQQTGGAPTHRRECRAVAGPGRPSAWGGWGLAAQVSQGGGSVWS